MLQLGHWFPVSDGDSRALALMRRHYSFRDRRYIENGPNGRKFMGPGEHMVLLAVDGTALFAWRKEQFRRDGQDGVNCSVFRNEGHALSSDLVREACELAWRRWPGERLYTYVNPQKIRSTNPGYCFQRAGFIPCGISRGKLVILERLP